VLRYIQARATAETKLPSRKKFQREDKIKVFQLASILIHDAVLDSHLSENLVFEGDKNAYPLHFPPGSPHPMMS